MERVVLLMRSHPHLLCVRFELLFCHWNHFAAQHLVSVFAKTVCHLFDLLQSSLVRGVVAVDLSSVLCYWNNIRLILLWLSRSITASPVQSAVDLKKVSVTD